MQFDKRAIYGTSAAAVFGLIAWGGASLRQAATPPLAPVSSAPGAVEVAAGSDESATASSQPSPPAPETPTTITVHVTGAVNRPGVYTLKPGDRVYHAIRAAGGLKPNAQQDALNQADFVQDADQIYFITREEYAQRNRPTGAPASASPVAPVRRAAIVHGRRPSPRSLPPDLPHFTKPLTAGEPIPLVTPAPPVRPVVVAAVPPTPSPVPHGRMLGKDPLPIAEVPPPPGDSDSGEPAADSVPPLDSGEGEKTTTVSHRSSRSSRSSSGASTKFRNPGDGVVNINTAGAAELQKLPGVGPAMSSRILEYRQQIGRFRDISQLQDVKGIGVKTLAKMRPFITVD